MRTLAATGGEASVHLVLSRKTGHQLILKLYNHDIHLKPEVLKRIQESIGSAHVVHLHGFGPVPDTGQWCEVQEYIQGGDLLSLMAPGPSAPPGAPARPVTGQLFVAVVTELIGAITAFHTAGLAHHDIKPSNILVRSWEPLDLVLADFGLSIAADRTVFLSRRAGTIAYDSPESLGAGQGGPKRDFWALGMTLAELAGARHPFAVSGRDLLSDAAIRDHLYARRPIDLSAVADPRARLLCAGLTRYDEDKRWGTAEVRAWLGGSNPAVVPDEARGQPGPAPLSPPVGLSFAGRQCATRSALADAIAGDWRASVGALGTDQRRRDFIDRVSTTFGSDGLTALEAAWAAHPPGVDRAISDLIATLDPQAPPIVVCGLPVDRIRLANLARSVASGDADAARAVGALYAQGCFSSFASVPGHQDLATVDRDWRAAVSAFESHVATARAAGAVFNLGDAQVQALLLGMVADADFARTAVGRRPAQPSPGAVRLPWYRPLATPVRGDHARALAAQLLAGEAARLSAVQEQARQQERRDRLSASVASLRAWLRWPIVAAALVAAALAACHFRQEKVLEVSLRDGKRNAWVMPLLDWAAAWWVWAAMAAAAFIARRAVRETTEVGVLRGAQAVSVVTTSAVPALVPFGVWRAFRSRRRRVGAAPSRLRKWAVIGAATTVVVLIGLWADRSVHLFARVVQSWPGGVQLWYVTHWPGALDPRNLSDKLVPLAALGLSALAIGLAGVWMSYTRPRAPWVTAAETVGAVIGIVLGVGGLPVLITGVAFLAYGALIAVVGVVVIVLIGIALADSC